MTNFFLLDGKQISAWDLIERAKYYDLDEDVIWMRREHFWFTNTCAAVLRRNGHSVKELTCGVVDNQHHLLYGG